MNSVKILLRVAAVACVIVIVVLSWIPKNMEVRTGMPGQFEHVLAYAGAATLALAAASRGRARVLALVFVVLAAILEIGQLWIPGRASQFVDFLASSAGAISALWVGSRVGLDRL